MNRAVPSLHEGSLEITLTVPLRFYLFHLKNDIIIFSYIHNFSTGKKNCFKRNFLSSLLISLMNEKKIEFHMLTFRKLEMGC